MLMVLECRSFEAIFGMLGDHATRQDKEPAEHLVGRALMTPQQAMLFLEHQEEPMMRGTRRHFANLEFDEDEFDAPMVIEQS